MTGPQSKASNTRVPLVRVQDAGEAALIEVPSGQPVTLQDVIWNEPGPEGLTVRFRFVAPEITPETGVNDFEAMAEDMLHLCQNYALPRVITSTPLPQQIVISLSDVPVEFGVAAPEATQFFDAFSIEDGVCIWEMF